MSEMLRVTKISEFYFLHNYESSYARPGARVKHGVEVGTVMAAGAAGGSGIRSDVLFALVILGVGGIFDRSTVTFVNPAIEKLWAEQHPPTREKQN